MLLGWVAMRPADCTAQSVQVSRDVPAAEVAGGGCCIRQRGLIDVPVQLCRIQGWQGFLLLCMGLMRSKICAHQWMLHVRFLVGCAEECMGIMSGLASFFIDIFSSAGSLVLLDSVRFALEISKQLIAGTACRSQLTLLESKVCQSCRCPCTGS